MRRRATAAILLMGLTGLPALQGTAHDMHQHGTHKSARDTGAGAQRIWLTNNNAIMKTKTKMLRQDGTEVEFAGELENSGPIYLNFIYTSCTTVCPLMGQIFADLQPLLRARGQTARLISISIDPEYDTPARLAEHAQSIAAGPDWRFYTGRRKASEALQRLFGTYTPDKMNHPITTFYRPAKGERWLRIDGFLTPDELVRQVDAVARD